MLGVLGGVLLFIGITTHANSCHSSALRHGRRGSRGDLWRIPGWRDSSVLSLAYCALLVWVSAVGFIFFAVYQAQRGEQWQPLVQNAFIVIAAVVVVEGLSRLFFGTA